MRNVAGSQNEGRIMAYVTGTIETQMMNLQVGLNFVNKIL